MTPEQFEQFNKTVQESIAIGIETNVNGKIRRLDQKLDNYIKEDNEWKESVTPSIEIMKKMRGFSDTGAFILKGLVLIGAAATAIYTFIRFIVNK